MQKVQLLYAANATTELDGITAQHLYFLMQVKNLAFSKQIDIFWCGTDGEWHSLPAAFHSMSSEDVECWGASVTLTSSVNDPLPGNIWFALCYRVNGEEHWDNNEGHDYFTPVGASLQCGAFNGILNIGFRPRLEQGQRRVAVTVHVPSCVLMVSIHWTTDDWKNINLTPCRLGPSLVVERGEEIIDKGAQLWETQLEIGSVYRLQYCICYETDEGILWENNGGGNYVATRKPLNVLALNLHCRQEDDQDYKFTQIAKAIDELEVDVVCLQEVAEDWNDAKGNWASNSVRIINDRLNEPCHIHTDWAHLGFDRYREGVAILSRYPITEYDARFLSKSRDPFSISTRKAVMGRICVPYFGMINVFSVHLSWWTDGFAHQFQNLQDWAEQKQTDEVGGTLLCGDFNNRAGSIGYELIVNSDAYDDEFLSVTSPDIFAKIFRHRRKNWRRYLDGDGRIDYVFRGRSSAFRATGARFIFTPAEYGRVSDHEGLLVTFEPI